MLEGFDFGVGMLLPFLARDEDERSALLATVGPHWDGNEVWLVIAAGATFAAFPAWYATMFSAFYLVAAAHPRAADRARALVRVARARRRRPLARRLALGEHREQRRRAVPVGRRAGQPPVRHPARRRTATSPGTSSTCSTPTRSRPGVAVVLLFALHGATFLSLRAEGALRERAAVAARRLSVPVALVVAAFLAWTVAVAVDRNERDLLAPLVPAAIGGVALVLGVVLARRGAERLGVRDDRGGVARRSWRRCSRRSTRRVLVSAPNPAEQPHDRRRGGRALRAAA